MGWGTLATIATLGLNKAFGRGGGGAPSTSPLPMPEAPKVEDTQGKADEITRRKRAAQTQTIYTSPLGVAGEAAVAKKYLTGQ